MNNLDPFMEIFVADVFLCAGFYKLYRLIRLRHKASALGVRHLPGPLGMPYGWVFAIGLFEITAALALLATRFSPWPATVLAALAPTALAFLMIFTGIYRMRRHQPVVLAFSLFLLAVFVIVGRM